MNVEDKIRVGNGVREWSRMAFEHDWINQKRGKMVHMGEIHSWAGMHTCWSQGWGYMEVIGNIWENPELLK